MLSQNKKKSKIKTSISAPKVVAYSSVFVLLVGVVAIGYQKPQENRLSPNQSVALSGLATVNLANQSQTPSVDEIVATDVAASLTERTNLPVAPNVANTAVSLSAKSELAQTDDSSISKPQIVQSSSPDRSVQSYTVQPGDNVTSIAQKYSITEDTVRWANNLTSNDVEAGKKLTILPVTGVEYTVKDGDTVASIADKYKANADRIVSYNDLELTTPQTGQKLILPGGLLPEQERPGYVAPRVSTSRGNSSGFAVNTSMARASAGNRYAYGNCTWYVYNRRAELGRPVGSFWGNANTWAINARAAGYAVNNSPEAGAVLVDTAGYYGHVAVVESVQANGDVVLSEMNNYAYGGFGIINSRTLSAGQASAYQYIH